MDHDSEKHDFAGPLLAMPSSVKGAGACCVVSGLW